MNMKSSRVILCFALAAMGFAADAGEPGRVLVFSRCEGYNHRESIAACRETLEAEAKKGRYVVEFSDDYAALKIENLLKYDALVLNNTTGLKTKENPHVAPAICSFVRWGGGLCALHAAADCFYDAPECAALVGGIFRGHPWGAGGTWAFKVEDAANPICAPFKGCAGGRFTRSDEIYQQGSPFYDRAKLHILVSLDLADPTTAGVSGQARADRDYAVSWVRPYGAGRVFYTSFAHDRRAWAAADTREHILAGLDYTLGRLKVDDSVPAEKAASCAGASLADCAAAVFDHPYTGCDGSVREARYTALGAALGRAVELGAAADAVPVAERVFASKCLPETLRACAARALLAANPNALARVLADPSRTVRAAAFGRGLRIPSTAFAAALTGASPVLKRAIVARLVQDGARDCVGAVVALADDPDEETVAAAASALGSLGGAAELPVLEKLMARGGAVGTAATDALTEMPGIGRLVFDHAATNPALLGIAARRAESKLVACWEPFLTGGDAKARKTAWRTFGKTLSEATFPQACAWFANVGPEEAETAANALWRVVKERSHRNAALIELWTRAKEPGRAAMADLISQTNGLGAFDVWEKLAADPASAAAAKKTYVALAEKVLGTAATTTAEPKREKWRATASRNPDRVRSAFDGKPETRWETGWKPKDQWFALDLGDSFFVDEVTLDTEKSANDTPKGAAVYISQNGADWEGPVATCDEKTRARTTFRIGRGTRHLKFVALGEDSGYFWSIHEIAVKAGVDKDRIAKIRAMAEAFRREVK
ncbi:MAG: ThuA domain-containing protein [Kiritimatiellia bacterium]